jgi:hypothetical protein
VVFCTRAAAHRASARPRQCHDEHSAHRKGHRCGSGPHCYSLSPQEAWNSKEPRLSQNQLHQV